MFESRATRRGRSSPVTHRNRRGHGKSRRLGVEMMEGRLMLSATTAEIAPPDLHTAYSTLAVGQLNSAGAEIVSLTNLDEGGFITTNFSSSGANSTGMLAVPGGVDATLSFSDLATRGQLSMSGAHDWVPLDGYAFDSDGLPPVVIEFSNNGGGLAPNIGPLIVTPPDNPRGPEEGGSIPIHGLLAGLRKEESLASSAQAISTLATEKPNDSHHSTRLVATSSDRAIAGEWGRAIIFEFAGGEPVASERSTFGERSGQPAGEATSQGDEPLSVIEVLRDGDKFTGRENGAAQTAEQAADVETGEQPANQPSARTAAVVGRIGSANVIGSLIDGEPRFSSSPSQSATGGQDAGASMLGKGDFDILELASAAAFEQFGDGKAAFVESSAGDWWGRSLGVTPLLMVLALERIAAHNSRRTTTEAPTAVGRKPLRPGVLTGTRRE